MIIAIGKITLQEFWNNPERIGIENINYIIDSAMVVEQEKQAFKANLSFLFISTEYLNDTADAFYILVKDVERTSIPPVKCQYLLDLMSRCRYYLGELKSRLKLLLQNLEKKVIPF